MTRVEHWRAIVGPLVAAQPWLVAVDRVQSGTRRARELLDLGAPSVFVVAGAVGAGVIDAGIPWRALGTRGDGRMDAIRASEAALDAVPPDVRSAVDEWDPEGRALAYRAFFGTGRPVAGRRCFGGRPEAW